MNVIAKLIARIEEYRATNKNPCKNYATEDSANKAAASMSKKGGEYYFGGKEEFNYVVFFNPNWGRWCVAFDMSEAMRRATWPGGYVGFFSMANFYTY